MKQIKKQILSALTVLLTVLLLASTGASAATSTTGGADGSTPAPTKSDVCHPENDTPPGQALSAEQLKSCKACKAANLSGCLKHNPIVTDLQKIIDVLSAGVGIVVVAMIIIGGIQYSIAGDSPEKLKEARKKIINALIALVAFMFLFGFVQWLIPGGVFG